MKASSSRSETITSLKEKTWDLCIIGGGINGAGVLRDAAWRGLEVCLLEKGDFASGTSSRSSKLIHGGVRYLEYFQFRLVFEACSERNLLKRLAPHLVRSRTFMIPFYGSRLALEKYRAGLLLYDLLAMFRNSQNHARLSVSETLQLEPNLRSENLVGSVIYEDCVTDDARLTLETLLDGVRNGGEALNYAEVTGVGQVDGGFRVQTHDTVGGQDFTVTARSVANLTGPWSDLLRGQIETPTESSDRPRLRPTKGAHIEVPRERIGHHTAVVLFHPADQRLLFVIPRGEVSIVGTTDTDYHGPLDDVHATREDVTYLLQAVNHAFPGRTITGEDIVSTYAALRPLINQEGVAESAVSREHEVHEEVPGLFSMIGGKLTTYRRMAEDILEEIVPYLERAQGRSIAHKSRTAQFPLFDGEFEQCPSELTECFGADRGLRLWRRYGERAHELTALVRADATLETPLTGAEDFLRAEIILLARTELVTRLEDLLMRRTPLFFFAGNQGLDSVEEVSRLLADELGWDEERRAGEVERFQAAVERSRAYRQ
jgi:glycerol-3-phosphate dehydrogenase